MHKGQVSAQRVVEGIKDERLMVASDAANRHRQSYVLRRKTISHLKREISPPLEWCLISE